MKMNRTRTQMIGIGALIGAAIATPALAGKKISEGVFVDTANRRAYGAVGSTRNTADTVQWIGCTITATSTSANSFGSCAGANSANTQFSCSISSGKIALMEAVRSIQGDSRLNIEWDTSGNCTRIDVSNDSRREPKAL